MELTHNVETMALLDNVVNQITSDKTVTSFGTVA